MFGHRTFRIGLVCGGLALPSSALALSVHAIADRGADGMPTATISPGVPAIGALYPSSGATRHTCTASVVHSPGANTLITAAHCVVGSGAGMVFAPGQRGTRTPYGRWMITAAYVEHKWVTRQDPHADVAFLTVAPRTIDGVSTEIEHVTGAYELGRTPTQGQLVTVTGYPAGSADDPLSCPARVYLTRRFPTFNCHGFVSGTSGSPWLSVTPHGTQIVGVIGGLHQGGCHEYTSYSVRLGREGVHDAYHRASDDEPGDVAPPRGSDGC